MPVLPGGTIGDWSQTILTKFIEDWFRNRTHPTTDKLAVSSLNVTGGVTAPTPATLDDSKSVATTEFVKNYVTPGAGSGDVPVWNGSAFVPSSTLGLSPSGIAGYPGDAMKVLYGDGTWKFAEIAYDELNSAVNVGTTATAVIAGSTKSYDGNPVFLEFFSPLVTTPTVAGDITEIVLYDGPTQVVILGYMKTPTAAQMAAPMRVAWRFTPSAGIHNYNIKANATVTTGTPQVVGGTGTISTGFQPAYLRITHAST